MFVGMSPPSAIGAIMALWRFAQRPFCKKVLGSGPGLVQYLGSLLKIGKYWGVGSGSGAAMVTFFPRRGVTIQS